MKRMITIGVCLVTAAIVYGFVDYLKTDKKQLQRMYGDEPAAAVPAVKVVTPPVEAAIATPELRLPLKASVDNTTGKSTQGRRTKRIKSELYSRAALEEKYIPMDTIEAKPAVTTTAYPVPPPPPPPVVSVPPPPPAPVKKRRIIQAQKEDEIIFKRLDASLFSRSSLKRKKPPVVVDTVAVAAAQKN